MGFARKAGCLVALGALVGGCTIEEQGHFRTLGQNLSTQQSRVLGFEAAVSDWICNNGSHTAGVGDASQGTQALAVTINGYTEIASAPIAAPGSSRPQARLDLKLAQQIPWGDVRLVMSVPSQGQYWRDLGSVNLSGFSASTFQTIQFEIPSDIQSALESSATDLSFRIIINGPSGSAFTLDNLVVSQDDGGIGDNEGSAAENFSLTVPYGYAVADVAISGTSRVTIDDRCTIGESGQSTVVSSFGPDRTEFGASVHVNGDIVSEGDVDFLRSQSHIFGSLVTEGSVLEQDNVVVVGGVSTRVPVDQSVTDWSVDWPLGEGTDIALPPDASNLDISPGHYDSVHAFSRSTLTLSSGRYFINSFVVEPEVHFKAVASEGPIEIYVRDVLILRSALEYIGGNEGNVLFGYLGNQAALYEAALAATVVSPNSTIELRRPASGNPHRGAFFGKEVHIFSDATVLHVAPSIDFACLSDDALGCECEPGFIGPECELAMTPHPPVGLPPPPGIAGCYRYSQAGWVSLPCVEPAPGTDLPLPIVDQNIHSDPQYGEPIQFAQVETTITEFGSMKDSLSNNESFSVQLNTGTFGEDILYDYGCPANACPGGYSCAEQHCVNDRGAVLQFAVQRDARSGSTVCIWEVDKNVACTGEPGVDPCTVNAGYATTCVGDELGLLPYPIPDRPGGIQVMDNARIGATVFENELGGRMVGIVAQLSWTDKTDALATYPGVYALVKEDELNLGDRWVDASGTILGLGTQSELTFTDSAVLTRLMAGTCANAQGPVPDVPWPGACTGDGRFADVALLNTIEVTLETNNLQIVGQPSPLRSITEDLVYTQYLATTDGTCRTSSAQLFVRDSATDLGVIPSNAGNEPFWESPDIFVVPSGQPVDKDAIATEAIMSPGQNYDIYVRVNNDFGCTAIESARALVRLSNPAALSSDWMDVTGGNYIGDVEVPPGESALIGPIPWTAPAIGNGDGHKCLLVAVTADGQPIPLNTFDAPGDRQVAQRNVQISDCSFPLQNSTGHDGNVEVVLAVDGPVPSLSSNDVLAIRFFDPGDALLSAWGTGAGSDYAITDDGDWVIVRIGSNGVRLPPVWFPDGLVVQTEGAFVRAEGSGPATVRLSATLESSDGSFTLQNGASCEVDGAAIIR